MPTTVQIIKNTVIKSRPLQSSQLTGNDKFPAKPGEEFTITSYDLQRNQHFRIDLAEPISGRKIWYVFREHCRVEGRDYAPAAMSYPLLVPYFSQKDNRHEPSVTCNLTSLAMVLAYKKVDIEYTGQLEDYLYQYASRKGYNRQSPYDIAQIAEDFGVKDTFIDTAGIEDAKLALSQGKPAIVHGYFTGSGGHILVLVGYNSIGFIVNDPWGRLTPYDTYDHSQEGRMHTIPYPQFKRLAMPDNYLWLHVFE